MASAQRPKVSIKALRFSDGTEIKIGRHETVLLVGPNNSGKSAALRGIAAKLEQPLAGSLVVTGVDIDAEGDDESILQWAKSLPRRPALANSDTYELPLGRIDRDLLARAWQLLAPVQD